MKLIDKDALVAEIDKRQSILDIDSPFGIGGMIELEFVKEILNTLEVKEVDLESEMDKYFETMEVLEHENIFEDTFQMIAKHFFELGLKVHKGE